MKNKMLMIIFIIGMVVGFGTYKAKADTITDELIKYEEHQDQKVSLIETKAYNLYKISFDAPNIASICTSVMIKGHGNGQQVICKTYKEIYEAQEYKAKLLNPIND